MVEWTSDGAGSFHLDDAMFTAQVKAYRDIGNFCDDYIYRGFMLVANDRPFLTAGYTTPDAAKSAALDAARAQWEATGRRFGWLPTNGYHDVDRYYRDDDKEGSAT